MNKTKIDWPWKPLYTLNPIVGCKHGCSYCYAKRMNDRFKWIPKWDEPQYFIRRLSEPMKMKKGRNIFIGSASDLFGYWISNGFIENVIIACMTFPQHTFFFLTKNPKRYAEFEFPKNCWLGTTITDICGSGELYKYCELVKNKNNKLFISIEPLFGSWIDTNDSNFQKDIDQIIVGAQTGKGAVIPKREWIESIKHPNIYYKDSITKLYPEFNNERR